MTVYRILKNDMRLNPALLEDCAPAGVYRTACLLEKNGFYFTVLASGRPGLPGSVTVDREEFDAGSFSDFSFELKDSREWDSLIRRSAVKPQAVSAESFIRETPGRASYCSPVNPDRLADKGLFSDMLGAGPGLTPGGDDFLVGAMNASAAFSPELFREIGASVAGLMHRTTGLSVHFLGMALSGRAGEDVIGLLGACESGDTARIAHYSTEISGYGATSGEYMLRGIRWALKRIL